MTTRKSILIIGWDQPPPEADAQQAAAAGGNKAQLLEKVKLGMKQCAEAGYDITPCLLSHKDLKGSEEQLRTAFQAQKWDGYIIGNGVRGIPEYTEFFEVAVNMGREELPGVRVGFNTTPADTYDAVVRNFG